MQEETLPVIARKLEKYIMTLPSAKKFNMLSSEPRKVMMSLQDAAYNLRINTERYFHADDSEEQKLFIAAAIEQGKLVDEQIMMASGHDLLGPVDVAHLSALTDSILERLQ